MKNEYQEIIIDIMNEQINENDFTCRDDIIFDFTQIHGLTIDKHVLSIIKLELDYYQFYNNIECQINYVDFRSYLDICKNK